MLKTSAKMTISYTSLGELVGRYGKEMARCFPGEEPEIIVEQSDETGQLLWCARIDDFWLCSHPHEQPVRDFVKALEKELCN